MPENEFEKQVQQKLDGLKFDPSVEVWKNVAAAVAKRKKDRRGLAVILLSLLLIGTTIFILFKYKPDKSNDKFISNKNNTSKIDSVSESSDNHYIPSVNDPANSKKLTATTNNTNTKKIDNQQKSTGQDNGEKHNPAVKRNGTVNNNSVEVTDDVHNITAKQKYKTKQKTRVAASTNNAVDLVDEKVVSGDAENSIPRDSCLTSIDAAMTGQLTGSLVTANVDTGQRKIDTVAVNIVAYNKNDTAIIKSATSAQKNKWKLGFNFSFGATTTQNGYLGIGSGDDNKAYDYASNSSTTGATNSGQANSVYYPSLIKPAMGIVIGLFVQRDISSKTNILIGVNYKMYSSTMMIGARVDSSILGNNNSANNNMNSFYYSSGSNVQYKNSFQFIELPVSFMFNLSKQNKLPIYLNTGISIAQLIGSNALQFDTSSGRYFNNNILLNKTQFNLSAGVLFSLSRQAKNPFLIGPDLNFSINKMANSGLYKNSHYSYLGIKIQKTIGKK
jgi:hypothetical protein